MLAKYNLYVGGKHENGTWTVFGDEATGLQDSIMLGKTDGQLGRNGTIEFSTSCYCKNATEGTYVYNSNSTLYNYVENYKTYLESFGVNIEEARLIKNDELEALGCSIEGSWCADSYSYEYNGGFGVRPVIEILKSEF